MKGVQYHSQTPSLFVTKGYDWEFVVGVNNQQAPDELFEIHITISRKTKPILDTE